MKMWTFERSTFLSVLSRMLLLDDIMHKLVLLLSLSVHATDKVAEATWGFRMDISIVRDSIKRACVVFILRLASPISNSASGGIVVALPRSAINKIGRAIVDITSRASGESCCAH